MMNVFISNSDGSLSLLFTPKVLLSIHELKNPDVVVVKKPHLHNLTNELQTNTISTNYTYLVIIIKCNEIFPLPFRRINVQLEAK